MPTTALIGPMIFPPGLPPPRVASYQPAERRLLSSLPTPLPTARAMQFDRLGQMDVEFIFAGPKLPIWQSFIRNKLVAAGGWFSAEWPNPTRDTIVCRFNSPPTDAEYFAGYGWRVRAQVEIRGRGDLPMEYEAWAPTEDYRVGLNIGALNTMTYGAAYLAAYPTATAFKLAQTGAFASVGPSGTLGDAGDSVQEVTFTSLSGARSFTLSGAMTGTRAVEYTVPGFGFSMKLGQSVNPPSPDLSTDFSDDVPGVWYGSNGDHRAFGESKLWRGWPRWNPGDKIGVVVGDTTGGKAVFFRNGVKIGEVPVGSTTNAYFWALLSIAQVEDDSGTAVVRFRWDEPDLVYPDAYRDVLPLVSTDTDSWNAATKGSNLTIAGLQLNANGKGVCKTTKNWNSSYPGQWMWEFEYISRVGTPYLTFGIVDDISYNAEAPLSVRTRGSCVDVKGALRSDRFSRGLWELGSIVPGDIIGFAYWADTGNVWIFKNGVLGADMPSSILGQGNGFVSLGH